ncbi:MAG: DUF6046 domain-containing protein [Bacteroidales bacterium]|nr:DUF6046 domain-containing protein [Bacteroidales bacterium]MDY0215959.1 DUF6046 domain-containing protein [Bacteroidales bacterium]
MNIDLTSRFNAAFGFIPGSLLGLGLDGYVSPLNVSAYVNSEGTFEDILLYRGSEKYRFAYSQLTEDYNTIFATPPMLSLKRSKKLIVTPIDNSDFEVIERYGTEPYEVGWRGLLIDMVEHQFPIDKMEALNKIFEYNGEWNVASEILNRVGVEAIYIKDITLEFVEGFEDTISYQFVSRAIRPLEYQLINQ